MRIRSSRARRFRPGKREQRRFRPPAPAGSRGRARCRSDSGATPSHPRRRLRGSRASCRPCRICRRISSSTALPQGSSRSARLGPPSGGTRPACAGCFPASPWPRAGLGGRRARPLRPEACRIQSSAAGTRLRRPHASIPSRASRRSAAAASTRTGARRSSGAGRSSKASNSAILAIAYRSLSAS